LEVSSLESNRKNNLLVRIEQVSVHIRTGRKERNGKKSGAK